MIFQITTAAGVLMLCSCHPQCVLDNVMDDVAMSGLLQSRSLSRQSEAPERISHLLLPQETFLDLDDLNLELVRGRPPLKLVGNRSTHKPVIWVHVHKSAGTTMCFMARFNGEAIIDPHANCNRVPWDDTHRWRRDAEQASLGHPDLLTCDERGKHWEEHRYTWSHIERPIEGRDICTELFFYGIALRDPLDLAESLLNFQDPVESSQHLCNSDYKACLSCLESGNQTHQCEGYFEEPCAENLWVYFDNFLVRHLGGKETMNLPPGGVRSEHVDMALQRLNEFDLVILVEDLGSSKISRIFEDKFGWNAAVLSKQTIQNHHTHAKQFSPEEKAIIQRRNEHDYRVYNHFKAQLG